MGGKQKKKNMDDSSCEEALVLKNMIKKTHQISEGAGGGGSSLL